MYVMFLDSVELKGSIWIQIFMTWRVFKVGCNVYLIVNVILI